MVKKTVICLAAVFLMVCGTAVSAPRTGVLLTDARGTVLYTRNAGTALVPASTLKVLTSLVVLERWGSTHRFSTRFALDDGNLHIKGLGDPLFISEAIEAACRDLTEKTGLMQIRDIILDQTWFDKEISIPGTGRSLNPYDATTGALCANFNTVYFEWDRNRKRYRSAEPQTPLLPVFEKQIRATGLTHGRILL
ncbi:MAG: D-alanyl-D-alanine carboxypeptidase, partial [Desulfobacterales bacterium]|nr:D-alanyl-D-alanine carboxypeptidase [Desulfobacterales bacterium]